MIALQVAVVDDEEPVRKALGRLLRASGLDAQCFPSGQAFLDSIETTHPDCLVLDLHMPGLSGLQVLEQLRSRRPPLPTIVITGHDEPQNEVRCLAVGAVAYMRKPLDDQQLLHTIDQAVHGQDRPPE
ncbi:MAG TPA: response regulator [Burkholderiales bacterium]|nr:response regulator [Burkholderiales bacterium]